MECSAFVTNSSSQTLLNILVTGLHQNKEIVFKQYQEFTVYLETPILFFRAFLILPTYKYLYYLSSFVYSIHSPIYSFIHLFIHSFTYCNSYSH
jgi:hypothetical protein